MLIGDFHSANELIDQWLSDDPDNPRLTVLRRALDGPEMTLPACEDQSVLKYVKDLMQRRASLHRPVVEPTVLDAQVLTLAQPSWAALVAQLTAAVEACKQSRYVSRLTCL